MPKRSNPAPAVAATTLALPLYLLTLATVFGLSLFVLHGYERVDEAGKGWSRLIRFGTEFAPHALPRLKAVDHYVFKSSASRLGYDGQFYAQLALDPSLSDPAFNRALDNPSYRARRIGLPALAYCLGGGNPAWILQAYALVNLGFWFVLAIALLALLHPWTPLKVVAMAAALSTGGVLASMRDCLTDLPAAAMIMAGLAVGASSWGGFGLLAAATLTRETSLLAAFAWLDGRRPLARRNGALLALAILPFGAWFLYVKFRFGGLHWSSGGRNFALPLQSVVGSFAERWSAFRPESTAGASVIRDLYSDEPLHELLTIGSLVAQGIYLLLRRDLASPVWRTGAVYLALGCVLGPAVWEGGGAAARVLLPMTLCFYLLLARERAAWFWPFFVLSGVALPYGLHEFWLLR